MGAIIIESNPNAQEIVPSTNNILMKIDQSFFHTYLPFWFQLSTNPAKPMFDKMSELLIYTYHSLGYLFGFTLLLLIIINGHSCVRLICSFAVCAFISMPFWYLFPATSPVIAYLHPPSEINIPSDISLVLSNYQPNEALQNFIDSRVRSNSTGPYTTIPSMHIAWVTVLVFYTITAWRPLAIVGIPYFFLNILSTVYTLQHYTADIVAGLIIAALATVITKRIKPEKEKSIAFILKIIHTDTILFKKKLKLFEQATTSLIFGKPKSFKESKK
jgi:membrane-associated phospholipid phosphatase